MIKETTKAKVDQPQEAESHLSAPDQKPGQKKQFVKPHLKRHELLPEVTTGFAGTFSP